MDTTGETFFFFCTVKSTVNCTHFLTIPGITYSVSEKSGTTKSTKNLSISIYLCLWTEGGSQRKPLKHEANMQTLYPYINLYPFHPTRSNNTKARANK